MQSALDSCSDATRACSSSGVRIQRGGVMGLGYTTAAAETPAEEVQSMKIMGSVAVITGGASGLGKATAEQLLAGGGKVALLDLPRSAGVELAKNMGVNAFFAACDVTSADEVAAALDAEKALTPMFLASS